MIKNLVIIVCMLAVSCNYMDSRPKDDRPEEIEKIDKERCSFRLPGQLFLGKIDSFMDEEGYFKILSYKSDNVMQLFVFNSEINVDKKLDAQVEALNSPGVFNAKSIEKIRDFGNYKGKGVVMKGVYEGGIVHGSIKIFCFGIGEKGFLVIHQMIKNNDKKAFDIVEDSFYLK